MSGQEQQIDIRHIYEGIKQAEMHGKKLMQDVVIQDFLELTFIDR